MFQMTHYTQVRRTGVYFSGSRFSRFDWRFSALILRHEGRTLVDNGFSREGTHIICIHFNGTDCLFFSADTHQYTNGASGL